MILGWSLGGWLQQPCFVLGVGADGVTSHRTCTPLPNILDHKPTSLQSKALRTSIKSQFMKICRHLTVNTHEMATRTT